MIAVHCHQQQNLSRVPNVVATVAGRTLNGLNCILTCRISTTGRKPRHSGLSDKSLKALDIAFGRVPGQDASLLG